MWRIRVNPDCDQRRQTSGITVEDSLQRTCNSSTDVDCYNHNMDCKLCECLLVPMEPVYLLNWLLYCDSSGSLHCYSLLLKNIL